MALTFFPRQAFRQRLTLVLGLVALANLAACCGALRITGAFPILVGSALLAYGLGLRHAFDADHIAAIDNVTRRLVAGGERPVAVGFFFSLGHSSVVVAATVGVAVSASRFKSTLSGLEDVLGPFGALVSSAFLLAVAGLNVLVFAGVWSALRRQRTAGFAVDGSTGLRGGILASALDRFVRRIDRSWLMYPLGVVFGLGFDTATEIGILGLTAAQATKGLPLWSILIFPALFAAGMVLADTLESLFMLSAYRWTAARPTTRLYYNLAATAVSVLAAVTVAAVQLVGLAPRATVWLRPLRPAAEALSHRSEGFGLLIVIVFAGLWGGWAVSDRLARGAGSFPTGIGRPRQTRP